MVKRQQLTRLQAHQLWQDAQTPQTEPLRRSTRVRQQVVIKTTQVGAKPQNQRRSTRQSKVTAAAPVLPEITVAGSDTESIDGDAGIYEVPDTPGRAQSEVGNPSSRDLTVSDGAVHAPTPQGEPTYNGASDGQALPDMQLDGATGEDAEGELQEVVVDGMQPSHDTADLSNDFSAILEGEAWATGPVPDDAGLANMEVDFTFGLELGMDFDGLDLPFLPVSLPPSLPATPLASLPASLLASLLASPAQHHQITETAAMEPVSSHWPISPQYAQSPASQDVPLPPHAGIETINFTSVEFLSNLRKLSHACSQVASDPKIRSSLVEMYQERYHAVQMTPPMPVQQFPMLGLAC